MGRMKASTALRRRMDAALGAEMEWDEREREILDVACRAADRRQELERVWAGCEDAALKVKLSGELRLLDRTVVESLARLDPGGEGQLKSVRHVRAAQSRWARRKAVG